MCRHVLARINAPENTSGRTVPVGRRRAQHQYRGLDGRGNGGVGRQLQFALPDPLGGIAHHLQRFYLRCAHAGRLCARATNARTSSGLRFLEQRFKQGRLPDTGELKAQLEFDPAAIARHRREIPGPLEHLETARRPIASARCALDRARLRVVNSVRSGPRRTARRATISCSLRSSTSAELQPGTNCG